MYNEGMFIRWLTDIRAQDRKLVGGKAASLGEAGRLGLRVPRGFSVTTKSYTQCLCEQKQLVKLPELALSSRPSLCSSPSVADAVRKALRRLVAMTRWPAVAVRSSGVAEDSPIASFAGQFVSFLNVRSYDEVACRIEQCWAELWEPRVIQYASRMQIPSESMAMAVLIQRMIPAEVSGVLFTADPLLGDPSRFVVEAGWGLGNTVVSGMQTPDTYTLRVDGDNITLESEVVEKAGFMSTCQTDSSDIQTFPIEPDQQRTRTLTFRQLRTLAQYGQVLTRHFGVPQDIEWAWYKGRFYILQTRPIIIPNPR